jgi:hypothetical protein
VFETFTERARKTISLARQEAQRLKNEFIATEHILLGILQGGDGVAVKVLKGLRIDLIRVRQEVEERVVVGSTEISLGQLPFSPGSKHVIEFAIGTAQQLGHEVIGTEHLLVGLLMEKEGIAGQVLAQLGLQVDPVLVKIVEILDQDTGPAPQAPVAEKDLRAWAMGYRALTDRPSVQDSLVHLFTQGRSIALVGPKRVGKTSIVLALSRARAGSFSYWSLDHRMFDEFLGRQVSDVRRPGTVLVVSQAELLTASRSVNANHLEDRMTNGERLLLEFRDGGFEAFAARYPVIAKDLVTVEVKAPDAAECRQLLESARTRLKETAQLEIADDVLQEADRLARDRWRLVVPPWPTIIALWTAEKIHRETSARGDVEQLEKDLGSEDRTPQEIELLRRHLEGLRSIGGTGLSIESVRRAIGELSGDNAIPG